MRFLAFFLCAAAFGAIDGTVNNRSTGKPQPGATVKLFRHGQGTGPELVASTKSDNEGRFSFAQEAAGAPHLIEVVHGGVSYTAMLPAGAPAGGVQLEVYDSSTKPGAARVQQRIVLLEPGESQLAVSETFFLTNPGNVTWHDPGNGTLRFFVPVEGKDSLRVTATAPQGMAVERAPQETGETGVYKLNFPIKPGETRVDVSYSVLFTPPGPFSGKTLAKGVPTRIIVPQGVAVTGEGLTPLGTEPSTQAAIFETAAQAFSLNLDGTGSLRAAAPEDSGDSGPSMQEILPRVYDRLLWLLTPAFLALGLGFVLLYRRGPERG
ncbi:MAG: hypothetical protein ACM3S5_10965 [Rhodospirillales bacterium]